MVDFLREQRAGTLQQYLNNWFMINYINPAQDNFTPPVPNTDRINSTAVTNEEVFVAPENSWKPPGCSIMSMGVCTGCDSNYYRQEDLDVGSTCPLGFCCLKLDIASEVRFDGDGSRWPQTEYWSNGTNPQVNREEFQTYLQATTLDVTVPSLVSGMPDLSLWGTGEPAFVAASPTSPGSVSWTVAITEESAFYINWLTSLGYSTEVSGGDTVQSLINTMAWTYINIAQDGRYFQAHKIFHSTKS